MNRRQWLSFLTLLVLSTSACVEPAEPATPQLTPTPARTQVAVPILVTETLLYEAGGAVEAGAEEGISPPKPRKPREYIKEDVDSPTLAENLPTNTPDTRLLPKYWAEWPLIPQVSERVKEIYRLGQEMGNDVRSFSTIGDCQSEPSVFMGVYDSGNYSLDEEYAYLEETIRQFQGSFQRDSITVKDGMSVASVLSPMWADPELCLADESPLECELRLHRPIIMFVNLGTNWNGGNDATHEKYMRQIVDILIAHGVVPILSTKGDNQDGKQRINQSIARVAYDYDIPLWNFWLSLRDLPGKGLDGSREGGYLSTEAWGRRSFTGLLALDAVWRELK